MYNNLRNIGKLEEHCHRRKIEIKELRERLEKQIKLNNPPPKTNEFIVMARYNQMIDEQRDKIPQKLREFFKEERDTNYIKGINPTKPIKNQNLKEETLGIIALLNLQYWCEDENEK